ncbi:JmjC domain-containing protein [Rhizobium ruizarguesonis]
MLKDDLSQLVPRRLEDLVGDTTTFFTEHWSKAPIVFDASADIGALINEDEIWAELDCGLLSRPYFTVFKEGVRAAIDSISTTRTVAGHQLRGFADADKIRAQFETGGTFKLSQAEHWHGAIRQLVQGMVDRFDGDLEAFVFLSPPGKTAMQAHTDGAHVFVLQVAGEKDWVVGRLNETSHSLSTLHEGEIRPEDRLEFTLRAGQVLYMPHGCPHYATAQSGNSIHVAITVEEPTAIDMANVILANFMSTTEFAALEQSHHLVPVDEKMAKMRAALDAYLSKLDLGDAVHDSIAFRKA